jgi:hypothetical protein
MTISPFIVTKEEDEGMFEGLKELVTLLEELISTGAGSALEVAVVNYEGEVSYVNLVNKVQELHFLFRVVGHVPYQGELKFGSL